MKNTAYFDGHTRTEALKKLFHIDFIVRAFFELAVPGDDFSDLLVINHGDKFLSLSNADHYILLLLRDDKNLILEAEEQLSLIQNRKKLLIQLRQNPGNKFPVISLRAIKQRALKNGIPENNLFLKFLEELPEYQFSPSHPDQ